MKIQDLVPGWTGDTLNATVGSERVESNDLQEDASAGATSSGSVSSVSMPLASVIRRPNLFGYVPEHGFRVKKQRKKNSRS